MIVVRLELVEFMDARAVAGAAVDLTITVAPRWPERIDVDLEEETGPRGPGGGSRRAPGTTTITIFPPREDLGESFTRSGITGPDGSFTASFDVDEAFRRVGAQLLEGRPPHDVVALLEVRVRVAGLDRFVAFLDGTAGEQSPNLLGPDDRATRLIAVDFAKSIVGHATTTSALLWFNLLASVDAGSRYVCEVREDGATAPAASAVLTFSGEGTRTAVADVAGLRPGAAHLYGLYLRTPGDVATPGAGRELARGRFHTAPEDPANVSFVFVSCHRPTHSETLERWQALARRGDFDFALMLGDQIYEDGLELLGDTWLERYVARYHQFWSYWPMREVMRRTPTWMIFDDHDVVDDWGILPVDGQRQADALAAYRFFQQAHNPGGADRTSFFYDFTWGPVAFFVPDLRSRRTLPPEDALGIESEWEDPPASVVLGPDQLRAFREWARSPQVRAADVIVFAASVPLAFLPVQEIIRLIEEVEDASESAGGIGGAIVGAGIGLAVGGPVGALIGGVAGAGVGAYAGHAVAESKLDAKGFADLTEKDLADQWTWEPNQPDLVAVLDVLFDLANDVEGGGARPRAVFVLGGDVHAGSMHLIRSGHTEPGDDRHARNPVIFQVISSPVSKGPATDKIYEKVVRHIQPGKSIGAFDIIGSGGDFEALAQDKFGDERAAFVLDDQLDGSYATEIVDFVAERNFGRVEVERVRRDRRVYRFYLTVEGRSNAISRGLEIDLDADPVRVSDLFQGVESAQGKLTLLRVHDVGTGFGPPADRLDAEVVFRLSGRPDLSFGFQLRADGHEGARRQMLDTLRGALREDRAVQIDYRRNGRHSGQAIRIMRT